MSEIRILGVLGSLRKDSYNRYALKVAQEMVPPEVILHLFELHDIPPFNQDDEQTLPPAVHELKRWIRAADAVLFATPEYNHSLPGMLKNAIDWASRPLGDNSWQGKPAAIMGASLDHMGTVRAQCHLRQILVALDMSVINRPEVMLGNAAQRFDGEGLLTDEPTRQHVRQLLEALIRQVKLNHLR